MEKIPQENMFFTQSRADFSQPMPKKILVLSSPNTSFSASTTSGGVRRGSSVNPGGPCTHDC